MAKFLRIDANNSVKISAIDGINVSGTRVRLHTAAKSFEFDVETCTNVENVALVLERAEHHPDYTVSVDIYLKTR